MVLSPHNLSPFCVTRRDILESILPGLPGCFFYVGEIKEVTANEYAAGIVPNIASGEHAPKTLRMRITEDDVFYAAALEWGKKANMFLSDSTVLVLLELHEKACFLFPHIVSRVGRTACVVL
ncbi:MAG: uncharacterized protein A8A55_3093, partial [Amphiamblys sp. WSBS2006]